MMDLGPGLGNSYTTDAMKTFETVFDRILENAVEEDKELIESDNPTHLIVSDDGMWKKRGFSFLFIVPTLVGHGSGGKIC